MSSRHDLPGGLELVRSTPVFDETTVPAGLLRSHRIAEAVWGRLVVHTGGLGFCFEGEAATERRVTATQTVVIPPSLPHHLVIDQPVTFVVEFYR